MEVLGALRYVYRNKEIPELINSDDIKLFNELKEKGLIHESMSITETVSSDPYSKKSKNIKMVWNVDTILAEKLYGFLAANLM